MASAYRSHSTITPTFSASTLNSFGVGIGCLSVTTARSQTRAPSSLFKSATIRWWWCAISRKNPRLPQHLPSPREPRVHGRQRRCGAPRLSLPPVELRPRWSAALRPSDGRRLRKTKFSLKPIACESVAGYLFYRLQTHPRLRAVALDDRTHFRRIRLEPGKLAYEHTIIEKGNWKLVWENNRECYHCAVNHPANFAGHSRKRPRNLLASTARKTIRKCWRIGRGVRWQGFSFRFRDGSRGPVPDNSSPALGRCGQLYHERWSGRPAASYPMTLQRM